VTLLSKTSTDAMVFRLSVCLRHQCVKCQQHPGYGEGREPLSCLRRAGFLTVPDELDTRPVRQQAAPAPGS
jgi:hypothetical protein